MKHFGPGSGITGLLHKTSHLREVAPAARSARRLFARLLVTAVLLCSLVGRLPRTRVLAQQVGAPSQNCVATLENRSVNVGSGGTFALPNIPVNLGEYRARIICQAPDGTTVGSTSDFLKLTPNGTTELPVFPLLDLNNPFLSQPTSLILQVIRGTLTSVGATVQLETQAVNPANFAVDATSRGTTYSTSNPAVAVVDENGLVTAKGPGNVVITARNDGLVTTLMLQSFGLLDSDGDGIPDAWEIANGLNPFDPSDASQDPDHDGLTNLQEYLLGTNPHVADTDGDGLSDGDEIKLGTNPLVADTDGDGLSDGDEVRLGTNPLNPDTDGDGIPDGIEVKLGLNPLVPDVTTTVTGHVTKADGSPYAGASVSLLTYFNAVTDSTGSFTLVYIPTILGNLMVSARVVQGSAVLSGTSRATAPRGREVTDVGTIQLGQHAGQVSGIITGPDNKPVASAQIVGVAGSDTRTATTDASGLYVLNELQAGPVTVSVFDPATSLRGQASGVSTGGPLTLNIKLAAFGTVAGTVRLPSGTPVGAGIPVTINGALSASTVTDTLGHYIFPFVPLGAVTLDATDANGNHGRATGTVTATAQNINADVQFLGRGTVTGVVADVAGKPVAGATVALYNNGQFSQSQSATTNTLGQFSFSNIFIGSISLSATSAAASTGGSATVNLQLDGQTVSANITLQLTGSISGTVFRSDGKTIVPGAQISLSGTAYSASSDTAGRYSIPNVPLGGYTLVALDPGTGDRGTASTSLATSGQAATANISLVGLGTVIVTVTDGGGTAAPGAIVTITASNPFYTQQKGVTAPDGTVKFSQQLAGSLTLSATSPSTGLSGTGQVTLAPNATATSTIMLQSAGTVQGTVFKQDGRTPVPGLTVQIDGNRQVLTDASGQYQLTIVPSGAHSIAVLDSQGNLLSSNNSISITSQGQTVTANFVIIGRGTVSGHVTNPDGSAAGGVPVSLTSGAPGDNHPLGTQTDVTGLYTIPLVPVGGYAVVAQQHAPTLNLYGSASGNMTGEGASVITDVKLSATLVPSTTSFTDANGLVYPIRESGAIVDGSFSVFGGDGADNQGGSLLSLVLNGTPTPFTGAAFSVSDLGARQISIQQNGLDGLNVTRRVYVPGDGYFARYIELLANPTAADITVGVTLTSNFRQIVEDVRNPTTTTTVNVPHILLTSSGDTTLNVTDPGTPDRWVTLGGPVDRDPFLPDQFADTPVPAIADVFSGPGATLAPSSVVYIPSATSTSATLTDTYTAVTVRAGATVGILHFVSQQNLYASANASAARLAQLPPEALTGLSPSDLSSIQNFAVPPGGTSAVPALPALTSQVAGFVYGSDGTTQVPGAPVHLQSKDPLFSRTYVTTANANGAYLFKGTLGGLVIPPEDFTVYATHPIVGTALTADCAQNGHYFNSGCAVDSPTLTGSFPAGSTAASQDLVFNNTGTLRGTVSRGPTVLNVSGTITISGGLLTAFRLPIQPDGTYLVSGLPPATYSVLAQVTNTLLVGIAPAIVTAGNTTVANVTIGDSGNIQGMVTRANGSLAVGDIVNLRTGGTSPLQVSVDTAGHYMFTDIPIGKYSVDSYDPQSNAAASASVTVASSATTTQNLVLQSAGTVAGQVSVNDGSSVANLTVTLTSTTSNGTQNLTATTDAGGNFVFNNVTPGAILLRTTTPAGLQGAATGALPLAGQTTTLNISLVVAGSLSGTVFLADGVTPAPGVQISLNPSPVTGSNLTTTDASGMYSYSFVRLGGFTVYASDPRNGDQGQSSGQIQTNGQQRVINLTLNGFGNLTVKVVDGNASATPGATISIRNSGTGTTYTGTADTTGTAVFSNIFAGQYQVSARDPATGLNNTAYVNVAAGSSPTTTVQLRPVGTIQGVVYLPDGVTPVAGATVQVQYGPTTVTAADGSYKFQSIALSQLTRGPAPQASTGGGYVPGYTLTVTDTLGILRAVDTGIQLQHNGDTITHNITLLGVGSVHGLVTNVDGTPLNNASLSVISQNPTIGGSRIYTTGGDGTYNVPEIAIGKFTVNVINLPPSLSGFATGTIAADHDSTTVNVQLISSTVTLPINLNDADGYTYRIAGDGTYISSTAQYGLSPFYNTQQLSLTTGGTSYGFGSGAAPTTSYQSLGGQQIEINQPSLAGLSVTRKIYVPTDGYFSRRLDVLQNNSGAPVTVAVVLTGLERYSKKSPQVTATSNGTSAVDKTIFWAVDSEESGTQYYPVVSPAVANVFSNTGAAAPLLDLINNINYTSYPYFVTTEYWTYKYTPVTIAPGTTASFLFFTAQEVGDATAATAAQRLVQLPAEALAGLSAADLANVVNFAIPATPLPAIHPPVGGALSGHAYAGDGTTPIPNATVYAQSTDLQYGSGTTVNADALGAYAIPALLSSAYAAEAVDPFTTVTSPTFTGSFAANTTTATLDIPFTNTGILRGLVKGTGLTTFTGGAANLYLNAAGKYINFNMPFGPDGVFGALTAPAGDDQIGANINTAQGGSIHLPVSGGNFVVNIVARQVTQFNLTLPATGSITGRITNADGTPAAGTTVRMGNNKGFDQGTKTDANGMYLFSFIPVDTYSVSASDPVTANFIIKSITITQDTTSTLDIQFIGKGTVVATVHYANGNVAAGVQLYISTSTTPTFTYASSPTDANGQFTFPVVPTGPYTVRAYYPGQNFYSVTTATLATDGQTQQLAVTLTPVGTITGKVTNANGTPAPAGVYVVVNDVNGYNGYYANAQTDSAGNYGLTPVPADRTVTLTSDAPNNTTGKVIRATAANQQLSGDGATLTVNLRYPGQANVKVTALQKDGTPYTTGTIYLRTADGLQNLNARPDATGSATFNNIVEATFTAGYVADGSNYYAGSKVFTVRPADDGTTVNVTIQTSATGTIKGQVFASDGTTPLRGSNNGIVILKDIDTGATNYAYPADDGSGYSFTNVQAGASGFELTAQLQQNAAGKQTATGNITTEGQVITQNFTLPVSSISGTVFLNDGVTPAPNVSVSFVQQSPNGTLYFSTTTDTAGTFQVSGPVTGTVTITAADAINVTGTATVTLATDTTVLAGVKVSLGAVGIVMGTVYDGQGAIVPNVQVTINTNRSNGEGNFVINGTTDSSGTYSLSDVSIGNVTVTAFLPDNSTETGTGVLNQNGDTVIINLGMVPGVSAHIFGTVYDPNGVPAPGATVSATAAAPSTVIVSAVTDANGVYTLSGLPVGSVSVSAVLTDGTGTASVTGNVPDTTTAVEFDLGLASPGNVSGVVYDKSGNPLPNVEIDLASDGDTSTSYGESTASDGSYIFGNIAPGTITLTIKQNGLITGTMTGTLPYGGNAIINVNLTTGARLVVPSLRPRQPEATLALAEPRTRRPLPALQTHDPLRDNLPNMIAGLSSPGTSQSAAAYGGLR